MVLGLLRTLKTPRVWRLRHVISTFSLFDQSCLNYAHASSSSSHELVSPRAIPELAIDSLSQQIVQIQQPPGWSKEAIIGLCSIFVALSCSLLKLAWPTIWLHCKRWWCERNACQCRSLLISLMINTSFLVADICSGRLHGDGRP
jgi:hypothetical protein